jgi:hypothetical protein
MKRCSNPPLNATGLATRRAPRDNGSRCLGLCGSQNRRQHQIGSRSSVKHLTPRARHITGRHPHGSETAILMII